MLTALLQRCKRLLAHTTRRGVEIEPDEIFLDSENLPAHDTNRLEGQLEQPISKYMVVVLGALFALAVIGIAGKLFLLQVASGEQYAELSRENRLREEPVFAERGVIYDRTGQELAWNSASDKQPFPKRSYTATSGMAHLIGYVQYPQQDSSGNFYRTAMRGAEGVEQARNERLRGNNGRKLIETNALSQVQSKNVVAPPQPGENVALTIDSRVQHTLHEAIGRVAREYGYRGGAGVIIDAATGDVLAMTSYPEYDPQILTEGGPETAIQSYVASSSAPFLNRAIGGRYTPGSIVKPFVALAALEESVIDPTKELLSTGEIAIQNPWNPQQETVFTDWKEHGWVDMRDALAVSSNVYFYQIGGGFQAQEGLGIQNIYDYFRRFGFGQETDIALEEETSGVIPHPAWKQEQFPQDPTWRLGDTYNTAIGQYGFQVTPLQAARGAALIANGGNLVTPQLVVNSTQQVHDTEVSGDHLRVVREGMRRAVTDGTASGLDIPGLPVAAKTGTAEVGSQKELQNAWIIGYTPADDPQYAFAVVMERGPRGTAIGGVKVMRDALEWIKKNTPQYVQGTPNTNTGDTGAR
jgi:penicillin-binding protein 2